MQFFRHCTAVVAVLSIAAVAAAQAPSTPVAPVPGEASFAVFVRGAETGRFQSALARSGSDWIVTSSGRVGDLTLHRMEIKYGADWQPIEMRIEATQRDRKTVLATSFGVTSAINEITINGTTNQKTDQISARTVPLPNNFFASYEALAVRLAAAQPGTEVPIYIAPQGEVKLTVKQISADKLDTPAGIVATRRYDVEIANPGGALTATVTIDERTRLAKVEIPMAALSVVRTDLASVAVRAQTARNPTDVDVSIPANGFSIAGTLTAPPTAAGRLRHPAVILVAGSGAVDRDSTVAGIPILSQIAGSLADKGFMVLRYDKRGIGLSGGRTEAAGLPDYADDLIAAVRWMAKRDDVDNRRLAVAGHSEGAAVAMLAAAREKRISSIVLIAGPGTTGAELILEQQRRQLELINAPEAERVEKIALQKRIQEAVVSGKGWDGIPDALQKQADTPWFRSLLVFDPAQVMPRVKQRVFVIQGDLDRQIPPHHAEKLVALANARKKVPPAEVKVLPGINHLLVPAKTGEVQEYSQLTGSKVSPEISETIAGWLK
jgi:pimeloyl-ACP methyl ester carboxylesterase